MLGCKNTIGLEIGNQEIRIAQVSQNFSGLRIIKYAAVEIADFASPSQALEELLKKAGLKPSEVVVSLPRNQVLLKVIQMPALKDKDLKQALKYAVEEHIPYPLNEVIYDYQPLGLEEGKRKVLLGAVRQDIIQPYLDILAQAGIKPILVEVDSLSVVNLCLNRLPGVMKGTVLIVNPQLGEACLLENGQFQFSRLLPEQGISDLIKTLTPVKLFVLGQEGLPTEVPGVGELVDFQTLGIGLKKGVTLSSFTLPGLAFRGLKQTLGINLSPLKGAYAGKEMKRTLKQTALLSALIFFLAGAIVYLDIAKKQQQIARIKTRLSRIQPQAEKVLAQHKELAQLKEQLKILEGVEKIEALEILNELANILPQDVWIKNLILEKGRFSLQLRSLNSASELLPILEASAYFEEVEFKGSIIKVKLQQDTEIKEVEEFTLAGKIAGL